MRIPAYTAKGEWRPLVIRLADALNVSPEELFTERQAVGGVKSAVREVSEEQIVSIEASEAQRLLAPSPEDEFEFRQTTQKLLAALNPRERRVVEEYLEEGSLGKLAAEEGVSKQRIYQIYQHALGKMRKRAERLHLGEFKELQAANSNDDGVSDAA